MKSNEFGHRVKGSVQSEPEAFGLKKASEGLDADDRGQREPELDCDAGVLTGLRLLAASQEGMSASPSVDSRLLQAFREQARTKQNVIAPARVTHVRWPWLVGGAIAAAVAASLLIVLALRLNQRAPAQRTSGNSSVAANLSTPITGTPGPSRSHDLTAPGHDGAGGDFLVSNHRPHRRPEWPRPDGSSGAWGRSSPSNFDQVQDGGEIVTDFMPASFGGNIMPMDSGEILRVKLPRSVMLSYGLPVNPDRVDEPITADLVVGSDGVARAIRFVREAPRRAK